MPETHFDVPQQIDKHFDVPKTALSERCLTSREIADYLVISVSTLRRRIDDDDFPAPLRIGRQLRWTPSSIQKWLDEQCGVK